MIYPQLFSTFIGSKSLKLSFTLNCVLTRVKTISNWLVFLLGSSEIWSRTINRNRSRTRQAHSTDIINIILTSSSRSRPYCKRNLVRYLQYGPRTRLVIVLDKYVLWRLLRNSSKTMKIFYPCFTCLTWYQSGEKFCSVLKTHLSCFAFWSTSVGMYKVVAKRWMLVIGEVRSGCKTQA